MNESIYYEQVNLQWCSLLSVLNQLKIPQTEGVYVILSNTETIAGT